MPLCDWLRCNRKNYEEGKMVSDRRKQFESSGLSEPKLSTNARPRTSLGDQETAWAINLDEAIKFRNENEHDPLQSENLPLYNWLHKNRKLYNNKTMASDRRKRFESSGLSEPKRMQIWHL